MRDRRSFADLPLAFALPRRPVPHAAATGSSAFMSMLTGDRPTALVSTAALTIYDVASVAIWALLLFLVARGSKNRLVRDLFGLVVAAAAIHAS